MNNIAEVINHCEKVAGRFVGDLNLLTLAAFNCGLSQVEQFENYSQEQQTLFNQYLDKFFSTDIPTAYIVGFELFLGERIKVTSDTLIPRFETEELVLNLEAKIRKKYPRSSSLAIADICSGSGVIGVSLYNRLKDDYDVTITFVDISHSALEVTKQNANQFGLNYSIYQGDMSKPLVANNLRFDVIVSNPPYIGLNEDVQTTVLSYEPKLALYANDNGLELYKSLIDAIILLGKEEFCLMLEIGEAQGLILDQYLSDAHNLNFEIIKDMNGFDRNLYVEV